MSELSVLATPRKRRRFTAEFKARIVEACQQPGAPVAGIALAHSLNANLVHEVTSCRLATLRLSVRRVTAQWPARRCHHESLSSVPG